MKNIKLVLKLSALTVAVAMVAGCNDGSSGSGPAPSAHAAVSPAQIKLDNGYKSGALRSANIQANADSLDLVPQKDVTVQYTGATPKLPSNKDGISFSVNAAKTSTCTADSGKKCEVLTVLYTPESVTSEVSDNFSIGDANLNVGAYVPARLFYTSNQHTDNAESLSVTFSTVDPGSSGMTFNRAKLDGWKQKRFQPGSIDTTVVGTMDAYQGAAFGNAHFGSIKSYVMRLFQYGSVSQIAGENDLQLSIAPSSYDYVLTRDFEITTDKGNIYKQDPMLVNSQPVELEIDNVNNKSTISNAQPISTFDGSKSITHFIADRSGIFIGLPYKGIFNLATVSAEVAGDGFDTDLLAQHDVYTPVKGDSLLSKSMINVFNKTNEPTLYSVALYNTSTANIGKLIVHNVSCMSSNNAVFKIAFPAGKSGSGAVMAVSNSDNFLFDSKINLLVYFPGNKTVYSAVIDTASLPKAQSALALTKTAQSGFTASPVVYTEHSFETSGGAQEQSHQPQFLVVNNAGRLQLLDPKDQAKTPIDIATFDKSMTPLSFACSDIDTGFDGKTYAKPTCYLVGGDLTGILKVYDIHDFNPLDPKTYGNGSVTSHDTFYNYAGKYSWNKSHVQVAIDAETGSVGLFQSSVGASVMAAADGYQITKISLPKSGEKATGIYDY